MVYGDCYAANKEIYTRIYQTIHDSLVQLDFDMTDTKELGKIKKVDPLGITDLRIRRMWHIENHIKVFNYIQYVEEFKNSEDKIAICLLTKEKFYAFPEKSIKKIIEKTKPGSNEKIRIHDVKIKNPNNPAKLLESKLILLSKGSR